MAGTDKRKLTTTHMAGETGDGHHGQPEGEGHLGGVSEILFKIILTKIILTQLHGSPTTEYDQQHRPQQLGRQALQQGDHFQVFLPNGISHFGSEKKLVEHQTSTDKDVVNLLN